MYPEILQHIERLQVELANVDPCGQSVAVAQAVAQIAAGLRIPPVADTYGATHHALSNGEYRPVFMQ